MTTGAALEEKVVNLETDSFYCSGYLQVQDAKIGCSKTSGHGAQTFTQALTNSCNPAFMEIGLRLGIDKFSYYLQGFGLKEKTGVDLPGEVAGVCVKKDTMSLVDLASSAFGQANELTALELITAYSAAINGGELITPYVVDHVTDTNGNVVLQNGKKVKRQVISEETSKTVREQLQAVVDNNPTHNAYIQGYKIGGKSGTAEIRATQDIDDDYVSSYCCFAPADDPQIAVLVMLDEPKLDDPYGSTIAAPMPRAAPVISAFFPSKSMLFPLRSRDLLLFISKKLFSFAFVYPSKSYLIFHCFATNLCNPARLC